MKSSEYQEMVLQLESRHDGKLGEDMIRLLHAAAGMCTESGEFMDSIKRAIFYGESLDIVNLTEELGDQLFYITLGLAVLNQSLDDAMAANAAKLRSRYPGGRFDAKSAIDRDTNAERDAMRGAK